MDALLDMSGMLSDTRKLFDLPSNNLRGLRELMKSRYFKELTVGKQQDIIMIVRETARKVGKLIGEFVGQARKESSSSQNDLPKEYREKIENLIKDLMDKVRDQLGSSKGFMLNFENREEFLEKIENWLNLWDTIIQNNKLKNIENMLLEEADISNGITLNSEERGALFYKKAFPDLFNMQNDHERRMFYYKLVMELGSLIGEISDACEQQPLALLLIGGLLSFRPMANNIWKMVKNVLDSITWRNKRIITTDHMRQIFTYCYNDLPYFLQPCFLYFACYPIGFEIPATSLTKMWIAEEFVEEEDKQTSLESTANKYLDQLVQRSLVFVSKRSISGTIKSCRLPRSIHEFAIQQSHREKFLVVNPNQKEIEFWFRLAVYQDNENQYTEVNHIRSFLAFNCHRIVLGSAMLLKVLALRNSTIPLTTLPDMIYLRYLSLRGSNISKLPENIGDMENLQTLDVRDTSIDTLPESLWNIKILCHVYVKPSPQIKGPPSETHIENLHTLKTVAVHESWLNKFPHFLIHLRKFALSNWDNLDSKFIFNLLSRMDNLISMAIMGNIIPSEAIDIRAFPNLETMKSAKLEGEWICRKLLIDNVKFPPNLTKLTLTKSSLKEDPMPTLERLRALKLLILQDEAYMGKQMVCSADGFPQLQFLKLEKLENLENWEVKPAAMSQLTTLRVVQCQKLITNHPYLGNHPNLNHVTDKVID
ncbi:inactive disease susceptibility protein LOV1-like [Carex rostrata]